MSMNTVADQQFLEGLVAHLDPTSVLVGVRDEHGDVVDLRYVAVNDLACVYLGHSREEMLARSFLDLFPEHRTSGVFRSFADVLVNGEPLVWNDVAVDSVVRPEGTRFDLRGTRVGDLLVLSWRDNTERAKVAAALAAANDRLNLLLEHSADAVTAGDNAGRVTWASDSVRRLTGWTPEQLMGRRFLDFVHPEDHDRVRAVQANLLAGRPDVLEVRFRTSYGDHVWLSLRPRPVFGPDGEVSGRVITWRDVQAEHEAREAAAEAQERLRAVVDAAPVGMAVLDLERRILTVNAALCDVVGRPERWFLARHLGDLVDADDLAVDAHLRSRLAESHLRSLSVEMRLVDSDGGVVWVHHVAAPMRNRQDELIGWVSQFVPARGGARSRPVEQPTPGVDTPS